MINEKLKQHAEAAIQAGVRRDGRKLDEFRPVTIETGISSTAHGSAKITAGDVIIVAGVKMEMGKPYPDTPAEGSLMVNAELLPLSNPAYESGPPSIDSIELARVVDRTIRESKAIDLKKLSIVSGESMWIVAADVAPINANGNLLDISNLATLAAIYDTKMPELVDGVPQYEKLSKTGLPIQHVPILVTVYKIGNMYLVDPTQEEEQYCDARLSIGMLDAKTLCALQKGGDAPLTTDDISAMVDIAFRVGEKLRKLVVK
jgi:exosome complex component RRP42